MYSPTNANSVNDVGSESNVQQKYENRIQIFIHAEKLPTALLGYVKPSPYAVLKITDGPFASTTIFGKTKAIAKCNDYADWPEVFVMDDFNAGIGANMPVPMKVTIYNEKRHKILEKLPCYDNKGVDHMGHDKVLAEVDFVLNEVYNSSSRIMEKKDGDTSIFLSVEKSVQGSDIGCIRLQLRGLDIRNVESGLLGLGRSDPYFEISKKMNDLSTGDVRWNTVYRSNNQHNSLNPYWDEFDLSLEQLCFCDLNWPLKITVWDYEGDGNHRVIGGFETTTNLLLQRVSKRGNADRNVAFNLMSTSDDGEDWDLNKEFASDMGGVDSSKGLIIVLQAFLSERNMNETRANTITTTTTAMANRNAMTKTQQEFIEVSVE